MKSKTFGVAIVMFAVGMFLLALYQRRYESENSGGEKVKLLSASKQLERGTILVDDMLVTREVPLAYAEDRAIKENERAKVIGLRNINLIQEGQTLMWTDLASGDDQKSLSETIPPGSRAVTIRTSREDSNAALIKAGDYVDVLSVIPDSTNEVTNTNKTSFVLMQRVLVLASGIGMSQQPNTEDSLLTLSVTLPEAQVLALAGDHGHLSVVVRPPGDQHVSVNTPDINSKQLYEQRASIDLRRPNLAPGGGK